MNDIDIETSQQDDRKYKLITLSNKLQCLLISDPTTDKASCAMDVRVGHLSDPENAEGLAHFLEHLLFMGTKKYPDENDYNVFLSSHGGSSNAFTDMESTNYYFDVSKDFLEGGLDRFAQFFINPLFNEGSTDRELQAVDSEHAKNLQNDAWRSFQLSKSLCRKSHPFSKFGSGNLVTLKEKPAEKGLDIRELLLEFHEKYYSANVMKMVIYGEESLQDLEALATKYLSDIPNSDIDVPQFPGKPFGPEELCKILSIVPVRDGIRSLELQFPMREIDTLYRQKPGRYISHLLGHEGAGSILELLKQKGWANELSAGESRSCSDWSSFSISIELTDLGLDKVDDIVEVVFSYLSLLKEKGVQQWIHDETATVAACQFRFLSKRNPMDYTCSLASAMQIYRHSEHILSGPYLIYEYDPEMISEFLKYFEPKNMILSVTSKSFEGTTTEKEHWYGTEYSISDLTEELCKRWSGATIENQIAEGKLYLPEMNDMIASDFNLQSALDFPLDEPRLLLDSDKCRVWYKPDNVFDMPKVNVMVLLQSSIVSVSVVDSVLSLLWTQIVQEHSNDFTYLASMASLHSAVVNSSRGIELTVSGYNHKAHILLSRMVKAMVGVPEKLELSLFERVKDKVSKQYKNFMFAQPYQHAFYAADLLLESTKWTIEDKMSALDSIEMCDVLDFSRRILGRFHTEMLVHGNVSADEAREMSNIVLEGLESSPPLSSTMPQARIVKLQDTTEYVYRMPEPNIKNTNTSIVSLYQVGPMELAANAVLALLHHLLKEPAFNELRTNEQLGYIVHTSIKTSGDNIKGLLFLIQSDSFDAIHLDTRVEAFLGRLRSKIVAMNQEEFQKNIVAVCQSLREKNKNIGEETSKYWHALTNKSYDFKRLDLIADEVEKVEKNEVLQFFDKFIAVDGPRRKKLSVQVFAGQHMEKFDDPVSDVILLKNVEDLRSADLYGLPKTVELSGFKI